MKNLLNRGLHLNRDLQTLGRFWFILETMASYGFRELAAVCFPERRKHIMRSRSAGNLSNEKLDRPARMRMMLEELGPTFIKFGQILSTRPDIIGSVYADELKKLTENVTPIKFQEVRACIENELGRKIQEIFLELDPKPLAAASIGQVHKGILADGHEEVVVKIRRPGVVDMIRQDLEIMRIIAGRLEEYGGMAANYDPVRIVEEFAHSLNRELDYMIEAANMTRFSADCADDPHIKTPKVFFDHTTESVMTMEFISGFSAAKVQQSQELRQKFDLQQIAENGVNSLLNQIFVTGFFHADPHPGNIFLLDDGRICFIDFGMMGRLNASERRIFLKVLDCMLKDDIQGMVDSALKMTISNSFSGDRAALERDAADLVSANINLPLERLSLAKILNDMLKMLNHHHLTLRPDLYMMFKSLITIEHLGRDFYPDLKIVEMVKPFLVKLKLRELDPQKFMQHFLSGLGENIELLQSTPGIVCSVLKKIENGEMQFRVEHHRLNDIEETLHITGERLSRSMLLAALFLGSALLAVAKIPPVWNDIPLPGMGGFLISGVLSLYTLWSDRRQRLRFLRERALRKLREEMQRNKY